MKVDVEIISNEIIKPSSPTPDHLRHYQLSFLDQLTPKTYNPLVLFYDFNNGHHDHHFSKITQISDQIKKSLSEVLTLYYPLAGRVKNDRFVECNDEGIAYSEALVNSSLQLSDALKNPNPSELSKFLPFELHEVNEFLVGVRLNIFAAGGIALGICISHQLADALSSIVFIKTWVGVSRGDPVPKPQFVSANLFPAKEDPHFNPNRGITKTVASKRFVFEASSIEAIRSRYDDERARSESQRRPSRVEALSVFIMSRFMVANRDELLEEPEKVYVMVHPVNIRPKLKPSLPENSFGNLYRCAFTMFPARRSLASLDNGYESFGYEMVRQIRESIEKVDVDFLKKVQLGKEEKLEFLEEEMKRMVMKGGQMIAFSLTSLCRFPLYDADFGWGEPLWVSSAALTFNNLVAFMDAKEGNAIEAYIGLQEEHLAKLEADEEFLKSVSNN